ncbi:type II secretion system protein [Candidatus Parcubacteria bacterium]|nr:MAG: type II secretion system protein [Candidatus Parcubacteria bacterium]
MGRQHKRELAKTRCPIAVSRSAFTLIELLVVIAIIGLLSSIVFASLSSARAKARDAQRFATIRQIQQALELYYDAYGSYPPCLQGTHSSDQWCGRCDAGGHTEFAAALQPLVNEGYLPFVPRDPLNGPPCYTYEYYTSNNPNTYGNNCNNIPLERYAYVIRFGTEVSTQATLGLFSGQRVAGREYCVGVLR